MKKPNREGGWVFIFSLFLPVLVLVDESVELS